MNDSYDELAAFDRDFSPQPGRRAGIESLPDGDHDFEVVGAELTRTEKSNDLILRIGLRVLDLGTTVEHAYFFRTQMNVDILGSDLCTLGFDADLWKAPHRPFSRELPQVVSRLTGIQFRGKKETRSNPKDPAKPYANLYVNQRLGGVSPQPTAYAPPAPGFAPGAGDDSDPIPF